ncbi:MAG: M28 family peptidase [Calditrichaeota bacterium]|nr:MAG: M28 family peptidase [Calditrichota bacterium]
MKRFFIAGIVMFFVSACSDNTEVTMDKAAAIIDLESYTQHVKVISSDEFAGRAPSSIGEEKTIHYLAEEFQKLGVQPGNGDSYFQEVSLVEMVTTPPSNLTITINETQNLDLRWKKDYVAITRRMQPEVRVENSPLVFAGYGIVAPEYGWNDYKGLDVKGKTVVVLVNDPGFATRDSSLFNGRAMTYYGRWTYKYEEAARQGATGIMIIHETEPAGYPWEVVEGGWTGSQFYLESDNKNMNRCALEGWLSRDAAERLLTSAGLDLQALKEAATHPEFKAIPLNASYSIKMTNTIKSSTSNNVLGLVPGHKRPEEVIIYTAHWDHFGTRPELEGDQILNGARDNATGTAALLELAKAFLKAPLPPERSILLLAVTAEEQGLLGSKYYAEHPVFPLNKTVAVLNMDALNIFGKMKDITIIGKGNSELDEYVERAAKEQGRYVRPDPEPEKGGFYRSDHFSFARKGVPALYTKMGIDHVSKGAEWTLQQVNDWVKNHYHKPSDEYDPETWDLTGAVDDIRLLFRVGYQLSMETRFPNWYPGNEFRALRDAMMKPNLTD